jgi:hypothetical protein
MVAPARRAHRDHAGRLALALELLRDPVFDALRDGSSPFEELPGVLAAMAAGEGPTLFHVITYGDLHGQE